MMHYFTMRICTLIIITIRPNYAVIICLPLFRAEVQLQPPPECRLADTIDFAAAIATISLHSARCGRQEAGCE